MDFFLWSSGVPLLDGFQQNGTLLPISLRPHFKRPISKRILCMKWPLTTWCHIILKFQSSDYWSLVIREKISGRQAPFRAQKPLNSPIAQIRHFQGSLDLKIKWIGIQWFDHFFSKPVILQMVHALCNIFDENEVLPANGGPCNGWMAPILTLNYWLGRH